MNIIKTMNIINVLMTAKLILISGHDQCFWKSKTIEDLVEIYRLLTLSRKGFVTHELSKDKYTRTVESCHIFKKYGHEFE